VEFIYTKVIQTAFAFALLALDTVLDTSYGTSYYTARL
jgi:hypothetical protein